LRRSTLRWGVHGESQARIPSASGRSSTLTFNGSQTAVFTFGDDGSVGAVISNGSITETLEPGGFTNVASQGVITDTTGTYTCSPTTLAFTLLIGGTNTTYQFNRGG